MKVQLGRIRPGIKNAIGLIDPIIAIMALLAIPSVYLAARLRQRVPLTRSLFDKLGVSLVRQHYYEPPVLLKDIHRSLEEPRTLPGIDLDIPAQMELLRSFRFADELPTLAKMHFAGRPVAVDSANYPIGDSAVLYSMLRRLKPDRFVEIGSGQTTLIALAAREANKRDRDGYDCSITCVEPYEQPWLEQTGVAVIRDRVELTNRAIFSSLQAGDVLLIDSSHVIRPQGDVVTEYLEVIPSLPTGVFIHVHDIRTPRDYSEDWVINIRRLWDEQYLLEALLSENTRLKVVLSTNLLWKDHAQEFGAAFPICQTYPAREPSSFWMQRR